MNFYKRIIVLSIILCYFIATKLVFSHDYVGHRYLEGNFPDFKVNASGTPDCSGEFVDIQSALQTWNNVSTTYIDFGYDGTTATNTRSYDGTNLMMWVESNWTSIFPGSDAIAVNTTWYNPTTGESYESDILFNGDDYLWSDNGSAGRYDVQNITTHELGHSVGLADLYDGGDSEKTMYGYSNTGETKKSSLETDDIEGAKYVNFDPQVSGTLAESEIWISSLNGSVISLANTLIVPSNVSLTINAGVTANLNSYSLRCTDNGIIIKNGSVSGYNIYSKYSSYYKGFFPSSVSITQALDWASSGWSVYVNAGTYNQNANLSVVSGKTLVFNPNVNLNFSSNYRLIIYGALNCAGSSGNEITIDGDDYSRSSLLYSMIDVQNGASTTIEYTNFTNCPYDIIVRNSADAEISHCTFSDFGFNSNSQAITLYYSTGDVDVNNCTFTGSNQYGIGIGSSTTGSNVSISNNSLSNCRYGIRCYSSDAWLTENSIQNSYYYGIYSDNVSSSARYQDNDISGNSSSYGIYLNSSSPYLFENTVTSNKVLINAGSPQFRDPNDADDLGYNTVSSAAAPLIMVQNSATPYLGYGSDGGSNAIYDTDFPHIYATNNSGVYADNNYWGAYGPVNIADGTSWILDRWPLDENPLSKTTVQAPIASSDIELYEKEDETLFLNALKAGFSSDYINSKITLKNLVESTSSSRFKALALLMYDFFTNNELQDEASIRSKETVSEELSILLNNLCENNLDDPLRPIAMKLKAREAAFNRDYDLLSSYNTQIINQYPNSIYEMTSLYDEIVYHVEITKNQQKAKELLVRMDNKYTDEELTLMAHIIMGENIKLNDIQLPKIADSNASSILPSEFKMYTAQPNPFNPSTIIRYELPENAFVKLAVYNVNGQKISELVNGNKDAGTYQVRFDGSQYSSGLYFYRIHAGKYSDVKRMLLVK